MFKIKKLNLYNFEGDVYTYYFSCGVNYIRGGNSTGKTEFYKFMDYMLGSSENIFQNPWFKGTMKCATLEIDKDGIGYILHRTENINKNYIYYKDEEPTELLMLDIYKERLESIFTNDIEFLKELRAFTQEELTYRSFMMFNFLGEKRQGYIYNFLDKCSDIKYSVKLMPILNFIFNDNLKKIFDLQNELTKKQSQLKTEEKKYQKSEFLFQQINNNLQNLGINIVFNGRNKIEIKKEIENLKKLNNTKRATVYKTIDELSMMYNNISEQIKTNELFSDGMKKIKKENENRKYLIKKLEELIETKEEFSYLVEPIQDLVNDLDNSISFSQYKIKEKTIQSLKKQKKQLRLEIEKYDNQFKFQSIDKKIRYITLLDEYLEIDISNNEEIISELRRQIQGIKRKIKIFQNDDNSKMINDISQYITNLYKSARGISSIVDDDVLQKGFRIKYIKQGNILQPVVKNTNENDDDELMELNYFIGSMARQTLMQLCGYFGFFKVFLDKNKYPVVPAFFIDHISKPFDKTNSIAIGNVINEVYKTIKKEDLQIFIFDDEMPETMNLNPDSSIELSSEDKTGFNPFYVNNIIQK